MNAALRTISLTALLALAPLARADGPALKGDLARLQGKWSAQVGPEKNIPLAVTFQGHTVTMAVTTPDGEKREFKGEFQLDDSPKPHKTIDWFHFTRPDGEEVPRNLSIYTLEGKTLTICSGGPGNERPTEFKAGADGPPNLVVLTRED